MNKHLKLIFKILLTILLIVVDSYFILMFIGFGLIRFFAGLSQEASKHPVWQMWACLLLAIGSMTGIVFIWRDKLDITPKE